MSFLQVVVRADVQAFEQLYDIKFKFDNANLVIENCPDKINKLVENKINMLLASKFAKTSDLGVIPGVHKIFDAKSPIHDDLNKLQRTYCFHRLIDLPHLIFQTVYSLSLSLFYFFLLKVELDTLIFPEVKKKQSGASAAASASTSATAISNQDSNQIKSERLCTKKKQTKKNLFLNSN